MKDFARQLTQKCVSMGLLDESYSEWFAYSIEKKSDNLINLACAVSDWRFLLWLDFNNLIFCFSSF